ncbi:uncharacterized protein KZ484_017506 [Pholidichthys leucotaenia]
MLSSTVVTVLAPPWGGRLRRSKRIDGTGNSETPANLQNVANGTSQDLTGSEKLQAQSRISLLGPRSNTVGWSTTSIPSSFDYQSKRGISQTMSLDAHSGIMNNNDSHTGALSPVANTTSLINPFQLDPNVQGMNTQAFRQGERPPLSSKPTTSSCLLSIRKNNSNGKKSDAYSTSSVVNPSPLISPTGDDKGKPLKTNFSVSFFNNNEHERPNPLLSPTSISSRSVLSSPPSNHTEENTFLSQSPSTSDTNRDENKNLTLQSHSSNKLQSPYNSSLQQKKNSLPLRTNLTTTSYWKQVTQERSYPRCLKNATNIKDDVNTPLVIPSNNNNNDMALPCLNDNKRFGSTVPNNRGSNNTTEIACKSNVNIFMKTQGGTHNLKQRNAENAPNNGLHRFFTQQHSSNLNYSKAQKPISEPGVLSSSKISKPTAQTVSHATDPSNQDISNSSFKANVATLLDPESSDTPTESSSSRYRNNHFPPKTNSTHISPHSRDLQNFTNTHLSLDSNQVPTSPTSSDFQKPPSILSFHSPPASPQTNNNVPTYTSSTGSAFQTTQFTNKTSPTPIGFERSYATLPKPLHQKSASSLFSVVNSLSKTDYSSMSNTSTTASLNAATPSSPIVSPHTNPPIKSAPTSFSVSSVLTPPTTPIITSPNSETSSPKEGGTFSSSSERDQKKLCSGVEEVKRKVRRVTWEDSVDQQCSKPTTAEKTDPSQVPASPVAPCRYSRSASSIFSFLRSNNPTPFLSSKTSSIQVGKEGKFRSLSSDTAEFASRQQEGNKQRSENVMTFDKERLDLTTPRHERTLSVESGTVQCRSSSALSLPPDFSSGYKVRYNSPPYSTLMSNRQAHGETKIVTPRSPLFSQPFQLNYTLPLSSNAEPVALTNLSISRHPLSPVRPSLPMSLPLQKKPAIHKSSKCGVSEADGINNNHSNRGPDLQNSQILFLDSRVQMRTQSLQGDKSYVTETLVYSIKTKGDKTTPVLKDTTPKPSQHSTNTPVTVETKLSQQLHTLQRNEAYSHSAQSSSSSSSADSQSQGNEVSSRRWKETVLGKSRFYSVEANGEQSPKKPRFTLKKSVSTPTSSEPEKANKSNNKVDQVISKIKQTFSTRRSDDDASFPWKWKKTSQAPSVSGSSYVSSVSESSGESSKTLEEEVPDKEGVLNESKMETDGTNRGTQNRYTLTPSTAVERAEGEDLFSPRSEKSSNETVLDQQSVFVDEFENKGQLHLTVHSPTKHQFDYHRDNGMDLKTANQFLSSRDPSPGRSPNPSGGYPNQFIRSTPSPRSPFSPFSSLSPVSPFSPPDVTDDNVFYSPKLQRRREPSSPCELGEGISRGGSRRSRASTGPPSESPIRDKEHSISSYADLKYGIEPGRSFSVSSVLSSRPSGPGRIATGSRFMSVGDLSWSSLQCGDNDKDRNHSPAVNDQTTEFDHRASYDGQLSYFPSEPSKLRSRSLPRSLTKCLAKWSSGDSPQPLATMASKPVRLRSPIMNTCQFPWDTEGPPTPPPTPPHSPVSRRISKPPSSSSPTSLRSSGALQQAYVPSKGYASSLATFEESSDSSSDTTTDDEYYLEDDGDKETEL